MREVVRELRLSEASRGFGWECGVRKVREGEGAFPPLGGNDEGRMEFGFCECAAK